MRIRNQVYRKPAYTGQYINLLYLSIQSLNFLQIKLYVKPSTIKTLVTTTKSTCSDEMSWNQEITYIKKTMQLNGYLLNIINKTIKGMV